MIVCDILSFYSFLLSDVLLVGEGREVEEVKKRKRRRWKREKDGNIQIIGIEIGL